jgi:hypothetical protein
MMMNSYQFQLIFSLHPNEDVEQHLDALFEVGCDDALISMGKPGYLATDFTRESSSAYEAIKTAVEAITTAIPHAKLIKAGPYIANLSEIANLFGCTRQNLSKYARGESPKSDSFPCPIVSGKVDYWYVLDVALWLSQNRKKQNKMNIIKQDIDILKAIHDLNIAIEEVRNQYDHDKNFLNLVKNIAA